MKLLAIDYGSRRLGLALSDPEGRLALPHETLSRRPNDVRGDLARLLGVVRAHEVKGIVMGQPASDLDADASPESLKTAREARRFASKLEATLREAGLQIVFWEQDERFSTQLAARALRQSGLRERTARERGLADSGAAAALLQTFLDRRAHLDPPRDFSDETSAIEKSCPSV